MVAAARLSEQRELCPPGVAESLEQILSGLELPVRYDHLSPADLWDAMRHDKKWQEGTARFVLLSGEETLAPVVVSDVTRAEVLAVLEGLREDA
jgi:3-dehydroquinate synthetase